MTTVTTLNPFSDEGKSNHSINDSRKKETQVKRVASISNTLNYRGSHDQAPTPSNRLSLASDRSIISNPLPRPEIESRPSSTSPTSTTTSFTNASDAAVQVLYGLAIERNAKEETTERNEILDEYDNSLSEMKELFAAKTARLFQHVYAAEFLPIQMPSFQDTCKSRDFIKAREEEARNSLEAKQKSEEEIITSVDSLLSRFEAEKESFSQEYPNPLAEDKFQACVRTLQMNDYLAWAAESDRMMKEKINAEREAIFTSLVDEHYRGASQLLSDSTEAVNAQAEVAALNATHSLRDMDNLVSEHNKILTQLFIESKNAVIVMAENKKAHLVALIKKSNTTLEDFTRINLARHFEAAEDLFNDSKKALQTQQFNAKVETDIQTKMKTIADGAKTAFNNQPFMERTLLKIVNLFI